MVSSLLSELPAREKEVIGRRFGLPEMEGEETLEEIGARLQVTRERIRQITKTSLIHLEELGTKHEEVQRFARVAEHLLHSYGGALEEDFFIAHLLDFASIRPEQPVWQKSRTCLKFLLDFVLRDIIEHREPANDLKALYALRSADAKLLSAVAQTLTGIIATKEYPLNSEELVEEFRASPLYSEHFEDMIAEPVHVARDFYGTGIEQTTPPTKEEEVRVVLAHAKAAAALEQNIFGDWGQANWTTIKPRRMNDKIYLILRQEQKPLHFTTIAERINAAKFDKKIARPPSVHNELILDKRFVLVGRGLYALKEWGYEPGTVGDVVAELLSEKPNLNRDEIVKEVLARRVVKRQTIHLALMNHRRFEKQADGRYRLVAQT